MSIVHRGDAIGVMEDMLTSGQRGSFGLALTSPPYWRQKLYGDDPREIGMGTLAEYVRDMVDCFGVVWHLLDDEGVLVLNIGDTASGSGGAGGDHNKGGMYENKPKYRGSGKLSGLPGNQWCDVPGRVLHALQDYGWRLRTAIVWDKDKVRRGDGDFGHTRRVGIQTEMIYVLVKGGKYRFDRQPIDEGRVPKGNVWRMAPNTKTKASYAPFPDELAIRAIRLYSRPDDRVLDPFVGSGTTCYVADHLGRFGVGIDLYEPEEPHTIDPQAQVEVETSGETSTSP